MKNMKKMPVVFGWCEIGAKEVEGLSWRNCNNVTCKLAQKEGGI